MKARTEAQPCMEQHPMDFQAIDDAHFAIEVEMQQKAEWTCAQLALVIHDLRAKGVIQQVPQDMRPETLPFFDTLLNPPQVIAGHATSEDMCLARQVCIDAKGCKKHCKF